MNKKKQGLSFVTLILHDIRSVHNVGAIFRTADAFGVGDVILSGYTPGPVDRFNRVRKDFHKAALGAENTVSWRRLDSAPDVLEYVQNNNYELIALEQDNRSVDIRKLDTEKFENKKIALAVGNEVTGVEQIFLDNAVNVLEIPQFGDKESLNVTSATSVALYALLSQ